MTLSMLKKKKNNYEIFLKNQEKKTKEYFYQEGFVGFIFLLTLILVLWSSLVLESFLETRKILDLISFVKKNKIYEKNLKIHEKAIKVLRLNPKTRALCPVEIMRFQLQMSFLFKKIVLSPYNNICLQYKFKEIFYSQYWYSTFYQVENKWQKKLEKKVFTF